MNFERRITVDQKISLKIIGLSLSSAWIAMLPIWLSSLNGQRVFFYSICLSAQLFTVHFTRFRLSTIPRALSSFVFGCVLLTVERASFVHYPIRIIIIVWLVLIPLIAFNQKLVKVVSANLLVFGVFFILLEIPLRMFTQSQASSQFQFVELFRNSRLDGPGAWPYPKTTSTPDGLRTTTDQPMSGKGRVLIFGGSTTYCAEVSDRLTHASILQRLLNDRGSGLVVENYGKSAATSTDRVKVLGTINDLNKNDIVIFYIGINESGLGFTQRDLPIGVIAKLPEVSNFLRKVSKYSRVADILFRKLVFGGINASENSKVAATNEFRSVMSEANNITRIAGAKFVPVLQANLFTRNPSSDYDVSMARLYGTELGIVMPDMYERLFGVISKYKNFGDARNVMNNLEPSPYFDWMHVDARGDERIAMFLSELLIEKRLIK